MFSAISSTSVLPTSEQVWYIVYEVMIMKMSHFFSIGAVLTNPVYDIIISLDKDLLNELIISDK